MVIRISDHVAQCYSAADGSVIADLLAPRFARDEHVTLCFSGITDVTSSFVNAAIVSFLRTYSADWLKRHISIQNVTIQSADLIRRCLSNGENNLNAA